jgi:hypothetical protein
VMWSRASFILKVSGKSMTWKPKRRA